MRTLAIIMVVTLAACGGDSGSDGGAVAAAPVQTPIEAFDTEGLLGQESYVAKSQTSILGGGVEIGGMVLVAGKSYDRPFELRYTNTETGETTRVLFTDRSGEYYIWPEPGTVAIQAILTDGRRSYAVNVTAEPGEKLRADLQVP